MEIIIEVDKLDKIKLNPILKIKTYLLLSKIKKPRQYFFEVLKDVLIEPKLTKEIFKKFGKSDLIKIGELLIEKNNLKKFYKKYKNRSFYYSFRYTLSKHKKEIEKEFKDNFLETTKCQEFLKNVNIQHFQLPDILSKISKQRDLETTKIQEFLKNVNIQHFQLQETIKQLNFHTQILSKSMNYYFTKQIELIGENGEQLVNILAEKCWVFPFNVPLDFANKIIKSYKSGNYDEIDNTMVNLIEKEDLKEFINKWFKNKYFHERKEILNEAIEAHINGKYSLSIYTFIPQIEGIIWDFLLEQYPDFKKLIKEEKISGSSIKKFKYLQEFFSENVKINFIFKPFFENVISKKYPLYNDVDDFTKLDNIVQPNRHVILHGIITDNFINEINSLKLIYLLDFIWYTIYLAKDKSFKVDKWQ